jgi:hypothetical protein
VAILAEAAMRYLRQHAGRTEQNEEGAWNSQN